MKSRLLVVGLTAMLLTGCATSPPSGDAPRKQYTAKEFTALTLCLGIADVAMVAASHRQSGATADKVKQLYAGTADHRLTDATIDRVYKDAKIGNLWDYGIGFFEECAQNVAGVPAARTNLASFCMMNGLIADAAWTAKKKGVAKEAVYARFTQLKGKMPNTVIDRVYAGDKTRGETRVDVWSWCMQPITERG